MKKRAVLFSVIAFLPVRFSLAEELTLEQVVSMALKNSHELKISGLEKEKAEYLKKSALSQIGPKLGVQGKIVRWDQPTDNDFGFEITDQLKQMGIEFPTSLHVMDQTTADVSLVVTQPLTPLYSLYKAYGVQSLNEEASGILLQIKTAEIRYKAAQSFFNLLKLLKSREIALKSLEQVEAHYERAMEFYKNGFVQKDDLLRAEVAMAKVKETLSQVDAGIDLAKSSLNLLMGMPLGNEIIPSGVYLDPPEVFSAGIDEMLDEALKNRGEIKEIKLRIEMAEAGRLAAIGTLIPAVSAVFNLSRQWGNEFQRETSYFIGLMLQWNFWEWGTTYYQIRAADNDIEKAKETLQVVKDAVSLDVKNSYFQVKTSLMSLEMNRKSVEQAQETFRIANEKYANKQATSMEVLDAESALTTAKNNYFNALYSYYLALENMNRAVGK